jgi:hypothetical protein
VSLHHDTHLGRFNNRAARVKRPAIGTQTRVLHGELQEINQSGEIRSVSDISKENNKSALAFLSRMLLLQQARRILTQHSVEIPRCDTPWNTHSHDKKTHGALVTAVAESFSTTRQKW